MGPRTTAADHLTLAEASRLFPEKNGKRTPVLTIKRWIINGYRGIRLGGTKVGNSWFTTAEAIAQFQADCTAKALGTNQNTMPDARLDAAAARAILERRGFFNRGRRDGSREAKKKSPIGKAAIKAEVGSHLHGQPVRS